MTVDQLPHHTVNREALRPVVCWLKLHTSKHLSVFKAFWRCLQDMFWRCIQHVFRNLKKSCKDVLEEEKLLCWRRIEDVTCWGHVFKASQRHVLKTFWTHVSKKSSRCLVKKQNVYWGRLYLMNLNKYLRNLCFPNLYPTKLR